jgi:hypothetical protein
MGLQLGMGMGWLVLRGRLIKNEVELSKFILNVSCSLHLWFEQREQFWHINST